MWGRWWVEHAGNMVAGRKGQRGRVEVRLTQRWQRSKLVHSFSLASRTHTVRRSIGNDDTEPGGGGWGCRAGRMDG